MVYLPLFIRLISQINQLNDIRCTLYQSHVSYVFFDDTCILLTCLFYSDRHGQLLLGCPGKEVRIKD